MGASIGNAVGLERALGSHQGVVAVIGDSTFVHSGITGLVEIAYNGSAATVIILDNGTTAMTGGQDHPATGKTLAGAATHRLDLEALARAIGIDDVQVVDPYDLEATEVAIRRATANPAPSVIIARRECVLLRKGERKAPLTVDPDLCRRCGVCFLTGCPAIEGVADEEDARGRRRPVINPLLCGGCEVCSQVCQFGAIKATDA
jgi:indolepyruvate ferredoxin oxidoreductase alpha subunit